MKKNKKALLAAMKGVRKGSRLEELVLSMVLQRIGNDNFEYDGDAIYTADGKKLVFCLSHASRFKLRGGVETIGEMAFRGKQNLRAVVFPSSLKRIEKEAFYDCPLLDHVVLPASVRAVKQYAFAECDSLSRITFLALPARLGQHLFSGSDNLREVCVPKGMCAAFLASLGDKEEGHFSVKESSVPSVGEPQE